MIRGTPSKQPFCVTPRRNLTKRSAWWQVGQSNNRKQSKRDET